VRDKCTIMIIKPNITAILNRRFII